MATIAVAAMQHETNTFAPTRANYQAFVDGGGWPGLCFGDDVLEATEGANVPLQGAVTALRAAGHRIVPLAWAAASPSAHVESDAYERITGRLFEALASTGRVDAVYLDLHGAMVTQDLDDGEGELLSRVRGVVGPRTPIVASLDLHANITRAMVETADFLSVYRTYPHVDMAATGERAAQGLMKILQNGNAPHRASGRADYLTAISSQSTLAEPCRALYALLESIERRSGVALSFAPGFPMADFPECGMTVVGYGANARQTHQACQELMTAVRDAEPEFALELLSEPSAVARGIRLGRPGHPIVLADTQDNPGAGGNGDTTGLILELLAQNAPCAVAGLLIDPASARQAHALGAGSWGDFSLGAISGLAGHVPVQGPFLVERVTDGRFECTGPMYRGFRMDLGPMALLRSVEAPGVRIVLASRKCQAADQAMFRHVGIDPMTQSIIALKSSVHFRADFQPMAAEILVVESAGPCLADPARLPWRRLRPGIRLRPEGPAFITPRR